MAYEHAGIHIKDGKETLVDARVAKRMRALGLQSAQEYLDLLLNDSTGEELVQFLDAISTNFTSFFREREHFDVMATLLKDWAAAGQRKFRIWSAASSSGEEPYSIAITAREALPAYADIKILATDISTHVLAHATKGVYDAARLEPLTGGQRSRYFIKLEDKQAKSIEYEARAELKSLLVFKRLNLSATKMPMNGPLDIIFVRNVMMYFDNAVRTSLIQEVERLLRPGGLLLIGHAESLGGIRNGLEPVRPSIFRKPVPGVPLTRSHFPSASLRPAAGTS